MIIYIHQYVYNNIHHVNRSITIEPSQNLYLFYSFWPTCVAVAYVIVPQPVTRTRSSLSGLNVLRHAGRIYSLKITGPSILNSAISLYLGPGLCDGCANVSIILNCCGLASSLNERISESPRRTYLGIKLEIKRF